MKRAGKAEQLFVIDLKVIVKSFSSFFPGNRIGWVYEKYSVSALSILPESLETVALNERNSFSDGSDSQNPLP
jgi:hypothetical protein